VAWLVGTDHFPAFALNAFIRFMARARRWLRGVAASMLDEPDAKNRREKWQQEIALINDQLLKFVRTVDPA
jgi:hypothetical protein